MDPKVKDLVDGLVRAKAWNDGLPTLERIEAYLKTAFPGAEQYAEPFYKAMENNHWHGGDGKPIRDWRALAKAYASKCWQKAQ